MKGINNKLDFEFEGLKAAPELAEAARRISVSGVQEKFPAVIDGGRIRLAADGERSTFILKPAPWDMTLRDRKMIPVNENLTMQIASRIYGIKTAENDLCFTPKGQAVYITKRFDIAPDGSKYLLEDFAAAIGKSDDNGGQNYKYNGCYLDIADTIRKYIPAWNVDMEMFFKTVVFNYIYANGDAHLKNFSLITINGERRLAPAYDLINTYLHVNGDDFGLDGGLGTPCSDVFDNTGHPCREDFAIFAEATGMKPVRYNAILDMFMELPTAVEDMVKASLLPSKCQRMYLRTVAERIARFSR